MGVRLIKRPYDQLLENLYYTQLNMGNVSWFDRLDLLYGKREDHARALVENVEDFYEDLYTCASVCEDLEIQIELAMFAEWIDIMRWAEAMRYPVNMLTRLFHSWGKK